MSRHSSMNSRLRELLVSRKNTKVPRAAMTTALNSDDTEYGCIRVNYDMDSPGPKFFLLQG